MRTVGKISQAAALVILLDLRSLSFAGDQPIIAAHAESMFKAGNQYLMECMSIPSLTYLLEHPSIVSLIELILSLQNGFAQKLKQVILSRGGAISIYGVTLKVQGRYFYDFRLHYFNVVKRSGVIEPPQFKIKATTILFVEGPDFSTADNLLAYLNDQLQLTYGVGFHSIQKTFIVVTDGAAVMAKMVKSSVSTRLVEIDQKWTPCY